MDQCSWGLATDMSTSLNSSSLRTGRTAAVVHWMTHDPIQHEGFLFYFCLFVISQTVDVIIQREVWLRAVPCEGPDGKTPAAHPGVQEVIWGGGTSGCQHPRPAGVFTEWHQQISAAQLHNKLLVMHHPLAQSLTWLHVLSLPQVAWKRRKSPACSSPTAKCRLTLRSTAVASARAKTFASTQSLRIPAPALWCPRLPSSPNTPTKPTDTPRCSARSCAPYVETTSSPACVMPGRERPSGCRRSNPPCWAATSSVWSTLSWWAPSGHRVKNNTRRTWMDTDDRKLEILI